MIYIKSATATTAAVFGILVLASGIGINGVAGFPLTKRSTTSTIVSVNSGLCLDDTNGSTSNGQSMQQWACTSGSQNQQWTFNAIGNGFYQIVNQQSGLCLDNGGGAANGTTINQWKCYSNLDNQLWSLPKQSDGSYAIVSLTSGLCIDVRSFSTANGGAIQQYECAFTTNQRWKISFSGNSPSPSTAPFKWGTDKMRGVNIGGWLVLEKFFTNFVRLSYRIVPSIFANNAPSAVDEWTFCQTLGQSAALSALTQHWNTC
ncbi:ricin B lectin domain-containing protein, partial [Endogone sp. FLAS-F59071]